MGAEPLPVCSSGFGGNIYRRGYEFRRFKRDELRERPRGRRTAKRTILKIRVTLRVMMVPMMGSDVTGVRRTELHLERSTTRRHEAHRDVCAKQKHGQQNDGQRFETPNVMEPGSHIGDVPCQREPHSSTDIAIEGSRAALPSLRREIVMLVSDTTNL
jgi:hypothetical protein